MSAQDIYDEGGIGIIEAVETLSDIADMDIDRDVGIAEVHDIIVQNNRISYGTVHWLKGQDPAMTAKMVKNIFRVVLKYLRSFYKKEYGHLSRNETIEEIKTIMVLVGEAAKKLDRFTHLFHRATAKSVTDLKEYRELQEFYLTRIARRVDEGVLGQWILGLTKNALTQKEAPKLTGKKQIDTRHVFIDLDSVKKDTEYELFFLRKEDGTRFFNPRLVRNVKLVCDFGGCFGSKKQDDPFVSTRLWLDRFYNQASKDILSSMGSRVDEFYRQAIRYKNQELVGWVNKAIMALMLSSNNRHLLRHVPRKNCTEYFQDFQYFLRRALNTREYLRWEAYPPKKSSKRALCLLDTIQGLCFGMYARCKAMQELNKDFVRLTEEANEGRSSEHMKVGKKNPLLWSRIARDYAAMNQLMKRHPNGPLAKVLELLEDGNYYVFDPLIQGNIPAQLFSIYLDDKKITNVRYATPTHQEFIHKSTILEEYKAFLKMKRGKNRNKHLVFNMQDKTSWREHYRSNAIEQLAHSSEFDKFLEVVTLPKDTEFYNQQKPYDRDHKAEVFMRHFMEHLQDANTGFHFSEKLKEKLFPGFVDELMHTIHRIFFMEKNVLTRAHRLDFIELFYMFLQLKVIELSKPDNFCFSCKDGIDSGMMSSAQLYALLHLINHDTLANHDAEQLTLMLYAPSVLQRERVMHPDRFHRMQNVLKGVELLKSEYGFTNFSKIVHEAFGRLFQSSILKATVTPPHDGA